MSGYPIVKNPMLPSPPPKRLTRSHLFRTFSNVSAIKASVSTNNFYKFMSQSLMQISNAKATVKLTSSRRIMPDQKTPIPTERVVLSNVIKKSDILDKAESTLEPIVHYNGPYYTMDQLPKEKLNWIREEHTSGFLGQNLKNNSSNYGQYTVLCKPYTSSQAITMKGPMKRSNEPKGTFYMRILQVTNTDSSKPCKYRCSVQINDEFCMSRYVKSEKRGKNSTEANFDETFLFDIAEPTTVTISLYAQSTSSKLFGIKHKEQDTCVGEESLNVTLIPSEKHLQRFEIHNKSNSDKYSAYQVLAVFGMYLSQRAQVVLEKTVLISDYVTVYVQGSMAPKRERFWAVLRGTQLEMRDFEYRENRPPRYVIPLDNLMEVFYPVLDEDDKHQIMNESHCLALQFSEGCLSPSEESRILSDPDSFEYRMYILSDTAEDADDWFNSLQYVLSIFNELHTESPEDDFLSIIDENISPGLRYSKQHLKENSVHKTVPMQLLW
ncbi:hypothetical protein BDF14DRAFT_1816874 [Spinellus fusiger]|nr:hypothetical protein BDF14DRAFT_1816874 [Spinellus fusiger]